MAHNRLPPHSSYAQPRRTGNPPRIVIDDQMDYSPDYFYKVDRTYSDWKSAWWREAIQNAVDAKSTHVDVGVICEDQKDWRNGQYVCEVYVDDDGRGMDQDTLVTKFLRFGGTGKGKGSNDEDSVGGFGKAKELLILPWLDWSMRTRDFHGYGVGMKRFISVDEPYREGSRLTVHMQKSNEREVVSTSGATQIIDRSYLPHIKFTVSGNYGGGKVVKEVVKAEASAEGQILKQLSFGTITLAKCPETSYSTYLLVRVKGLYMFTQYVYADIPKGKCMILEVTSPSTTTFTDNRDQLLPAYQNELTAYLNEVVKDSRGALRDKEKLETTVYVGSGKMQARELSRKVVTAVEDFVDSMHRNRGWDAPPVKDTPLREMSPEEQANLVRMMKELADSMKQRFSEETAKAILETSDSLFKDENLENLFKKMVWEPDFILTAMEEGFKIPKEMRPASMAPRVAKLATVWTELCRYVAAILKIGGEFGVGFAFGSETHALYQRMDGEDWLLLNPYKNWMMKTLWSPTSESDLSWLFAAAIHECTHYQMNLQGLRGGHDENFAISYTNNVGLCAKGWRKVRQIEKGAKMTSKVNKESFRNG